jgi:DUF1365 family protein
MGSLRHRRARPLVHDFTHKVWYLALDLGELDLVDRRLRLLSHNRWNVLSVLDRDHLGVPATDLEQAVRERLVADGNGDVDGRVTLVTYPRVLGYVFNPVSFYLCRDRDERLRVVLAEVHNTHGEQHVYTLEPDRLRGRLFLASHEKDFYVSPFLSMDGRYEFAFSTERGRSRFVINEFEGRGGPGDQELNLHTALALQWRPLTDRNILRALGSRPLMTLQTIGLIHLHALRLWLGKVPFHSHAPAREMRD